MELLILMDGWGASLPSVLSGILIGKEGSRYGSGL